MAIHSHAAYHVRVDVVPDDQLALLHLGFEQVAVGPQVTIGTFPSLIYPRIIRARLRNFSTYGVGANVYKIRFDRATSAEEFERPTVIEQAPGSSVVRRRTVDINPYGVHVWSLADPQKHHG